MIRLSAPAESYLHRQRAICTGREEKREIVDVVLDTLGGDTQQRSLRVLKPGGILVSSVSPVPEAMQKRYGVRAAYFYVDVTTARLNKITELFDSGKLVTHVGTVLPLEDARIAGLPTRSRSRSR
jgi:NADPH:quinone reductase-like Zn-dependent oxidoreductase